MPEKNLQFGSLLRIRKQEMDKELAELYRLVQELSSLQVKIRESEIEHHAVIHSVREKDQTGNEIHQLAVHRHYLEVLRDRAKEHTEIAEKLVRSADEAREKVEVAVNRYRIVENLRDRRREQELARINKAEVRNVDDETTTRFAARVQSEPA
ncbi:MAG: hypothetical protein AAEJ04_07560 [Planctomycetota bacterium]